MNFKWLGASLASASGVEEKGVTREGYLKGQYAKRIHSPDCTKVQEVYAVAMNEGKPYTIGALARLVKRGQATFSGGRSR